MYRAQDRSERGMITVARTARSTRQLDRLAGLAVAGMVVVLMSAIALNVIGAQIAAGYMAIPIAFFGAAMSVLVLHVSRANGSLNTRVHDGEHVSNMLEGRLDALLRHAADVVVVLTPSGTCVYISPSADWVLGIRPESAVGRPLDVLLGSGATRVLEQLTAVASHPGLVASLEFDFVQPDGSVKVLEARLSNLVHDLAVGGVVLHVADVTDRRKYEQLLTRQAETDALTGLLNRSRLDEVLAAQWTDSIRRGKSFAVLFADLDGFKVVNDRCGHEAGDEVLREVAKRLQEVVRSHDVVVRFGGDEFVVVCPNTDADAAAIVARRINEVVCQPVLVNAGVAEVGVSIGIAVGPGQFGNVEGLMRFADETMYRIKQNKPSKSRR